MALSRFFIILFSSFFALTAVAFAQSSETTQVQQPASSSSEPRETIEGTLTQNKVIIVIPTLAVPVSVTIAGLTTDRIGYQIAQIISADLERSGLYQPFGPDGLRTISIDEVIAPQYDRWSRTGGENLVQGYVRANRNGSLTVGCYLYDIALKTELIRRGFVIQPSGWRRAAHRCADAIYVRLSGEAPFFDSRIAYIAERGTKGNRIKQLAIMDSDGGNHRFITSGQALALSPRFSPDYQKIVYVSYLQDRVRIFIYDVAARKQRLVLETRNSTFAPRWSPTGTHILFSMAVAGNTDIYRIDAHGGTPQRLTNNPSIDVGGSFSPDGRKIIFESDRSGSQQIYVMNADGSQQKRISFAGGRYATPTWSPRGDLIAFTKMGGGKIRIGVMTPSGENERLLTNNWQDEAPTWAPNGRLLQFFRTTKGRNGRSTLWQVDLTGVNMRQLQTPQDGSDPAWGPILP